MKDRKMAETSVTMSQVMQPQDANPSGNFHGGNIMKLIVASIALQECARHNE